MEQVPTKISRRSLALGGPAAVAMAPFAPLAPFAKLAALAPVGVAAGLGVVHNSASAYVVKTVLTVSGFVRFFEFMFVPEVKRPMAEALMEALSAARGFYVYAVYSSDKFLEDESILNEAAGLLTADQHEHFRSKTYLKLYDRYAAMADGTKHADAVYDYLNYIEELSLDPTRLKLVVEHHQNAWHLMQIFLKVIDPSKLERVMVRAGKAEAELDNGRYLKKKASTSDDLVNETKKDWLGRTKETGQVIVRYGDSRKLVKRYKLQRVKWWYASLAFYYFLYDSKSKVRHGIQATVIETPGLSQTYSDAYTIGASQTEGIDWYIDEEMTKNGAFAGMSDDQSRRMLRSGMTFVARETGLVYEGYVATQLILRAASQAIIALTRFRLTSKEIDLGKLAAGIQSVVEDTPEYKALLSQSLEMQEKLIWAITGLIGLIFGSVVLAAITVAEAKAAVTSGNNTAAIDKTQTFSQVTTRLTSAQSSAQLTAIGVLGFAGLSGSSYASSISLYAGSAFAVSDLTGGISDFVTVFKGGNDLSASEITTLVAGSVRIVGAGFTLAESFYKVISWDKKATIYGAVPAVKFNSYTASVACGLYFIAAALAAARR